MKRLFVLISLGLGLGPAHTLLAFKASDLPPLPNFDRRSDGSPKTGELPADRAAAADQLKARVPALKISVNPITGTPKSIASTSGFLTGPNGQGIAISPATLQALPTDDPHRTIKAFLNEHSALFGHGAEVLNSALLTRDYVTTHNGLRTVVWQQQLDGIPVHGATLIGNVTKNGELVNLCSRFLPVPAKAADAGTPNRAALQAAPGISGQQAVVDAAAAISETVALNQVVPVTLQPDGPQRIQRFTAAPVMNGETGTELVWLPLSRSALRLCWQVRVTSRQRGETYLVLLDAENGTTWLRQAQTFYLTNATYTVWTNDSPTPLSPGLPAPAPTQPPVVPRTMMVGPALYTNASPNGWIDDPVNETRGNNVDAYTDHTGTDTPDLPRPQGNPFRVFNFPVDLTQTPTNYSDAAVTQLFFWANWYHDVLYQLGFTEAAGNYQNNNFGRGGLGNDAVLAQAQDGGGTDNANFTPAPDGTPGLVRMYLWSGPTPNRDGDFDGEVVWHELTHGTSWRLVGGGFALGQLQSDGMGEGWSDWYALAMHSEASDNVGGNYAAAAYVSYLLWSPTFVENYYYGIRRYPYCTNMSINPLTFKDIDPTQADPHVGVPLSPGFSPFDPSIADEVHNQGEVWCVTLWEARASLVNKYGWAVGNQLMLQLVTDGMKLTPAVPTFLEARDAIIQADLVDTGGANFNDLWAAFAKRGMGGSATCPDSSTTIGVQEAFDLPGLAVKGTTVIDTFTGNGNGVVDPNECIELNVTLVNNARYLATGVSATLSVLTPGVLLSQPVSTYPNIPGGGTAVNDVPFKFYTTPSFLCGAPIDFALRIQSVQDVRTAKFRLSTGLVGDPVAFHNDNVVTIPQGDLAGVDSIIQVSGFDTALGRVTASLHIKQQFDFVLQITLYAPDGTRVPLSNQEGFGSDFGVACSPETQRTTFDDKADVAINGGIPPFVGSFRPEQPLALFVGKSGNQVNGPWRLHIVNLYSGLGSGTLQCWSLNLSPTVCTDGGGDCSTDLAVSSSYSPSTLIVQSNVTYSITVTNRGPNSARNVVLTDTLPAGAAFVLATSSRGGCTQAGGIVTCSIGSLANTETANISIVARPTTVGTITNVATVASTVSDPNLTNNTSIVVAQVYPPIAVVVPAGAFLLAESFSPPDGGIDPGETVTLKLLLQNVGSLDTANLVATLLSTGGVTSPSAPQTYGVVAAGGPPVGNPFTFTAAGSNGGTIAITLQLQDGTNNMGLVTFNYGLGGVIQRINPGVIAINDNAPASPYPSTIFLSGLAGLVNKVSVTFSNMSHTSPSDVDALLVGPNGQSAMLMAHAGGGGFGMNNVTLTFDDSASASLPAAAPILPGTYLPTYLTPAVTNFPVATPPAPPGPYGTALSVFNGSNPNGLWALYIIDDTAGDNGRIANGWILNLAIVDPVNPTADLFVAASGTPNPILAGSNLTYTILVTNLGPKDATGVKLTNTLPASVAFLSATNSHGTYTVSSGKVIFDLGTLTNQTSAALSIVAIPTASGTITNIATASANEVDRNSINSTAKVITTVNPTADLAVSIAASPDPATIGNNLTYTVTVTNQGPNNASGVTLTNRLPPGVAFVSALPGQGSCSQAGGVVTCSLGSLARFSRTTVAIVVTPFNVGPLTNTAFVAANQPVDLFPTNNTATLVTIANNPSIIIVPAGSMLLAEASPPTGGIEAGETVTVGLGLKNIGVANTTALVATLRNSGGITGAGGPQPYGVLVAGGSAVTMPFSFTAQGANGGTITATLDLADGTNNLGIANFAFILGATLALENGSPVGIPDNGPAVPYPSTIVVSNLAGTVSKVSVTLSNLSHAYPDDIEALLVGPNGQATMLMADVGGGASIDNVTITFDDAATNSLPSSTRIFPGTYKPTSFSEGFSLPPPAPAAPYVATLSIFNGSNPNGTWSLCIIDDTFGDLGRLNGGWSLAITTVGRINSPPPSLSVPVQFDIRQFQFTIHGEVGSTVIIEASSELASGWTPISTNTLSSVSLTVQDPNSAAYGRRFYRARSP